MRDKCWFGDHPIRGKTEYHHKICRRYYRRGQDHRRGNLVPCCHEHHQAFHRRHDNPKWTLEEFLSQMESLDFGRGIFAGERHAQLSGD